MTAVSRTIIDVKPGKKEELESFIDQKSNEITAIEGLKSWGFVYLEENKIMVLAIYVDQPSAENATPYVNEVLADAVQFVTAPQVRNIYSARWF